jgi:hypothetical protein
MLGWAAIPWRLASLCFCSDKTTIFSAQLPHVHSNQRQPHETSAPERIASSTSQMGSLDRESQFEFPCKYLMTTALSFLIVFQFSLEKF